MKRRHRSPKPIRATEPSAIVPRLLNRQQACRYLGISASMFDAHRVRGLVPPPVPVPSTRNDGRSSRVPLFDIRDLDGTVDNWKRNGNGGVE